MDVGWFRWMEPHQEPLKSHDGQRWTFQPRSLEFPQLPQIRGISLKTSNSNLVPKASRGGDFEPCPRYFAHGDPAGETAISTPDSLASEQSVSQALGNAVLVRECGLPGRPGNACHSRCSSPNRYPKVPQFRRNHQPRGIRKYPNFHSAGLSRVVPETLRRSLVRS